MTSSINAMLLAVNHCLQMYKNMGPIFEQKSNIKDFPQNALSLS